MQSFALARWQGLVARKPGEAAKFGPPFQVSVRRDKEEEVVEIVSRKSFNKQRLHTCGEASNYASGGT